MAQPRNAANGQAGPVPEGDRAERFLVLCLRGRWDRQALVEARALAAGQPIDWDRLGRLAGTAGLAPLLYTVVRGQALLPPAVEAQLRRTYAGTVARNTYRFRQLEGVLDGLAERGVEAIVLKGAALSWTVYRPTVARPMMDLDLLLRPGDVQAALDLLDAMGYRSEFAGPLSAGVLVPQAYECHLEKPGTIVTNFDLHWHLFGFAYYREAVPMDWFWETAAPERFGSSEAKVLGPEAQLLHLCVHAYHHAGDDGQPALRWLQDIAEVTVHYEAEIDWDGLLARAQVFHLVPPLRQALLRVSDGWQVPVPAGVLEQLSLLRPLGHEEYAFARFKGLEGASWARQAVANLASLPTWGQRLGYAGRDLLFPRAGYMRLRYDIACPALVPLYYPYRWLWGLLSALPFWRSGDGDG